MEFDPIISPVSGLPNSGSVVVILLAYIQKSIYSSILKTGHQSPVSVNTVPLELNQTCVNGTAHYKTPTSQFVFFLFCSKCPVLVLGGNVARCEGAIYILFDLKTDKWRDKTLFFLSMTVIFTRRHFRRPARSVRVRQLGTATPSPPRNLRQVPSMSKSARFVPNCSCFPPLIDYDATYRRIIE